MRNHIDEVRRAIEFGSPSYVPMELVDVPHIYNAYGTLDAETVKAPEGAEDFDSAWVTYHWTFQDLGRNERGEPVRKDEWGCTQIVPNDTSVAYQVIERPTFNTLADVEAYPWPDPEGTNWFFESRKQLIEKYYPDRFICGLLDPAPFVVAFELFGYDGLLLNLYDRLDVVLAVFDKILQYQLALIPKFRAMGAHMVNVIDEVAGTSGMMFSPRLFRTHFKPMYDRLFSEIHRQGMYASLLLDGNLTEIMDDLAAMDLDQHLFVQANSTGLDTIADYFRGKRCLKVSVDMMRNLATGTPAEIEAEVDSIVRHFRTDRGGLVFEAMRWHRPEFAAERVRAQIQAMNRYR